MSRCPIELAQRISSYERSLNDQIREIIEVASLMTDIQYGALSFNLGHRQLYTCTYQFDLDELPIEQALCQYVIKREQVIEIVNAQDEEHKKITTREGQTFLVTYYLGLPIKSFNEGLTIGSLCLFHPYEKEVRHEIKVVLQAIASTCAALLEAQVQKDSALKNFSEENDHFVHEVNNAIYLCSCIFSLIRRRVVDKDYNLNDIFERVTKAYFALENILKVKSLKKHSNCILTLTHKIIQTIKSGHDRPDIKITFYPLIESGLSTTISNGNFYKIISNLIFNAIDATKENRLCLIEVLVTRNEKILYVSVKDNGKGIQEEDQLKIFNTIFTTKKDSPISGRGLKMINEYVKSLNGQLCFKTAPTKGTQFIAELPILQN